MKGVKTVKHAKAFTTAGFKQTFDSTFSKPLFNSQTTKWQDTAKVMNIKDEKLKDLPAFVPTGKNKLPNPNSVYGSPKKIVEPSKHSMSKS